MSSILKALEKVEESQSTRRSAGVNGLARGRERRPAWVVPAGVLGGAAVAALVTFAAMGGFSHRATPAAQVTSVAKSSSVLVAPLNPVTEVTASQPAAEVVVPQAKALTASFPALPVKSRRVAAVSAARPLQAAPVKATPVPVATPEATAPVAPEKASPEIRVTGIAWQKDSASSAAIVNGHPVQSGGMVDGYKVEEIFEDKVRFSGSNGKIDVQLGGGE
jgi:general secretion pathway protein B